MIGIIEAKEEKSGGQEDPRGAWKRIAFTIGGKKYSTFDTALKEFNAGDCVNFEFKTSEGGYNNITSMVKTNKAVQTPVTSSANENDRQNSIERQCALKSAVKWCNAQEEKTDVLTSAEIFLKWIQKKE